MKVLLIEDDPDVSETIISIFKGFFENAEVHHLSDGKDFKKGGWKSGGWSVVILDLMMPGITGFEVCEQLRAFPKTKNIPIFALTGYDTTKNEEKIRAAGASAYMAKPFEVKNFLLELNKLLKTV